MDGVFKFLRRSEKGPYAQEKNNLTSLTIHAKFALAGHANCDYPSLQRNDAMLNLISLIL